MIVIVAEKPSVGRDIARVLGCRQSGEGCIAGEKYTVTWAVGHLVTLSEPDEIDEKYKKWRTEDLPILPDVIPTKVISKTKKQFSVILPAFHGLTDFFQNKIINFSNSAVFFKIRNESVWR